MDDPGQALAFFVVFLFSTTLHEAAHAWAALRGGDPTAYQGGQVTLDPRPHIRREPFGMIVLPLISVVLTGWPLGFASAPYDPDWARRHPRRAAWMALAGPASNFLLVVVAVLLLRVGEATGVFYAPERVNFGEVVGTMGGGIWAGIGLMLGSFFSINLLLGFFNLLPLPPLDGSGAMPLLLSEKATRSYQETMWSNPALSWIGILVAWQIFAVIFDPIFLSAVNLLYPGVWYE